ncbi:hypothetical protein [Chloracidobacterium aggregatum]|uniref:hypothetical protein n=1 Tax=Chloracidobacterium aggregatum TaxID=2851959 RepID=UPI001B8AEC3F|nr:hypothetical protein [Chloracidobacterium aggregatum]QUV90841.1 hypothetical protein J8C04_11505 [Chloracidobacterium sp. A]
MLPAQPSPLFQRVVHAYNQHLLRRAFHAVWWRGVDVFTAEPRRPLLIYANHPGWWDPLLAFFVVRRTGRDGYMMAKKPPSVPSGFSAGWAAFPSTAPMPAT